MIASMHEHWHARIDPQMLSPVQHRSAEAQIHLMVIRARAELVKARTALVNSARGLVKSYGERLRQCGTRKVGQDLATGLSVELREALGPLLREVQSLNAQIKEYDRRIEKMVQPHLSRGCGAGIPAVRRANPRSTKHTEPTR
jgi:transposase